MDIVEAIRNRKTIRRFSSQQIEDGLIDEILEAGRRAPSASNTQPWRFVVVRDETRKAALAEAAGGQKSVSTAQAVIVVCGETSAVKPAAWMKRWAEFRQAGMEEELTTTGVVEAVNRITPARQKESERLGKECVVAVSLASNVAIAVSFMTLRAHELGLGSCWIGAFLTDEVRKIVRAPDSVEVMWMLAVGYPDITPVERPRKSIAELVRHETWETEQ
jgi:nitroreductase